MPKIRKILIVGGGLAGWLTASYLSRHTTHDITVLESPHIPNIGVGESVGPGVINWLEDFLGLNIWTTKSDVMIKVTNFFSNWSDLYDFHFSFEVLRHANIIHTDLAQADPETKFKTLYPDAQDPNWFDLWFRLRQAGLVPANPNYYLCPQQLFIDNNTVPFDNNNEKLLSKYREIAFHLDANTFHLTLKDNIALPNGVKNIVDHVKHVEVDQTGIKHLVLQDNTKLEADLYIDCTGFSRLLVSKVNNTWTNAEYEFHPNRAWVCPLAYADLSERVPYTQSQALDYGWKFVVTLKDRMGQGYVFNNNFVTIDNALTEFEQTIQGHKKLKEPRLLEWQPGHYKSNIVKNVASIGPASGFLEVLDASLFPITIGQIGRLGLAIRHADKTESDVIKNDYKLFAQDARIWDLSQKRFRMQYSLSHKNHTEFWRAQTETKLRAQSLDMLKYLITQDKFISSDNIGRKTYGNAIWPSHNFYNIAAMYNLDLSDITSRAKDYDLYSALNFFKQFRATNINRSLQGISVDEWCIRHQAL
jgi:tryptophan halogenase